MKKPGRLALYSLFALILAIVPATLIAAPGPGRGPGFGHGHRPDDRFGGLFAELIAEHLDLSAEQREEIRSIRESYRDETESLFETLALARLELQDSIHADVFDESAVRAAAGRVGAVEADLAVLRARMASDVHQVLTPEQLAEARELRDRMRERADEWRGHRRWGRGGPGGPAGEGD